MPLHPKPVTPAQPVTGWRAAFEHTGIPTSWLRRPRLPSRRWMAFITTVASVGGAVYYDRRECKRIQQSYIEKVKHLATVPMATHELPRKVKVYACKWPGDEDHESSLKWFKRHVKPILVAAAIDYDYVNGNQHGNLMRHVSEGIRKRRRLEAGLDEPTTSTLPAQYQRDLQQLKESELQGGTVIVGRHTMKEYMEGLNKGWSSSLEDVDEDDVLSKLLENDGYFDEPLSNNNDVDPVNSPSESSPGQAPLVFSPMQLRMPPAAAPPKPPPPSAIPTHLNTPLSRIPQQPPLLLVPYHSVIGWQRIPVMMLGFFNRREEYRKGAAAAYRLVASEIRPFEEPSVSTLDMPEEAHDRAPVSGDLAFDLESEAFYRPSYESVPKEIEAARKTYYKDVIPKLETARALARNEREPTKDEIKYPPPTEVELREKRSKKEKRWREDLEAWNVLHQGAPVAWHDRFRGAFNVFTDGEVSPPPESPASSADLN